MFLVAKHSDGRFRLQHLPFAYEMYSYYCHEFISQCSRYFTIGCGADQLHRLKPGHLSLKSGTPELMVLIL
jgi:hypothetical protein